MSFHAVDEALDGIAVVVDHEDDHSKLLTDHGGELLYAHLQGAVTDEEKCPRLSRVFSTAVRG